MVGRHAKVLPKDHITHITPLKTLDAEEKKKKEMYYIDLPNIYNSCMYIYLFPGVMVVYI